MAIKNKNGYAIDKILVEEMTIDNKTSTNAVEIQDRGSDSVFFVIEADTAINLSAGGGSKTFTVTPLSGAGHAEKLPAIIITEGVQEKGVFAAGDIIAMFAIPNAIIGVYTDFKINVNSNSNGAAAEKVNVYTVVR